MPRMSSSGTLWVVATPIGNLADASPRAIDALARASAILCEDTRRTRELLAALKLDTDPRRLHRFDQHVERARPAALARWLEELRAGRDLALVSDAGTPGVSDPGAELVRAALEAGLAVSPVAGPSALAAFVSVAGFTGNRVVFAGFFPREAKAREAWRAELARLPRPALAVFFESPNRVADSARWLAEHAAPDGVSRLIFAKELTKKHERIFAGAPQAATRAVLEDLAREGERGEWVLAIELSESGEAPDSTEPGSEHWLRALRCALAGGVSASRAAKIVSQEFGVKKNLVYSTAVEIAPKISAEKSDSGD